MRSVLIFSQTQYLISMLSIHRLIQKGNPIPQGSGRIVMSGVEKFNHVVTTELAGLIPEEVRGDSEQLKDWVNRALEIGLKAMIQGSGSVDLAFVNKSFEDWKEAVSSKLIGDDSDFEQGLKDWFEDDDGSFQKAFDLDDPKSPFAKFLAAQKTDRITHETAMKTLVEEIKNAVIKDSQPKQAHQQGGDFEDDIETALNNIKGVDMDNIERVGTTNIKGTANRKTGDVLIEIVDPSSSNLKICTEAKSGADYTLKGKKTLWDEMSESMSLRGAQAVIGVVDLNNKASKHGNWLVNGDDRIIVAVDWEEKDFTLLEVAYQVLRNRVIGKASGSNKVAKTKAIDSIKCEKLLKGILEKMEVIGSMRTKLTGLDKGVEGIRGDLNKLEKGVGADVGELRSLLS